MGLQKRVACCGRQSSRSGMLQPGLAKRWAVAWEARRTRTDVEGGADPASPLGHVRLCMSASTHVRGVCCERQRPATVLLES